MKVLKKALANLFKKPITIQYPEVTPHIPERFRGRPEFFKDKCIGCGLCGMICPSKAIKLGRKRERVIVKGIIHQHLRHPIESIDLGKCIYCGHCAEICPSDAIEITKEFELAYGKT